MAFCGRCGAPMSRDWRPVVLVASVVALVLICVGVSALWKLGDKVWGVDERLDSIIGSAEGNFFQINSGVVEAQVSDKNDALELLEEMGPSIGVSDARSTLAEPEVQSGLSNSFYRFSQTYEGIPVYGRSVVVGANEKGDVISVTGNYRSIEGLGTTPALSSDDAVRAVGAAHEGITATCLGLCVYSLGDVTPTLAWQVDTGNSSTPTRYFVGASTGEIVAEEELYDSLASITATDINGDDVVIDVQGNEDGTVSLIDESRNIRAYFGDGKVVDWTRVFIDDACNEFRYVEETEEGYWFEGESGQRLVARKDDWIDDGMCDLFDEGGNVVARNVMSAIGHRPISIGEQTLDPFSGQPSVFQNKKYANLVTLYVYLADVADYYQDTLNRDGFNGNGGTLHLVSDASFDDFELSYTDKNAFTDSGTFNSVIAYGKDLPVSRVALGHEFTHAVITNILGESGGSGIESGALSEAICDLTGIAIEDYCNDGQFDNDAAWEIPQFRNLADPNFSNGGKKHLPTSYGDENWKNGQINPHDASTVISHAGYLMCCDDSLEGDSLTTEQLSQLVYVTLFSLPMDCNFSQFRVIMENACTAMVDQGLLDPAQRTRVSAAFDKVNVQRSVSLYGLTKDATLQVFDVNNQPYGDYVAYVGPYRENYMPSPGEEDVYTITPASSDPVSLNFPRAGKYQISVANLEGLQEGEKPHEYWDAPVAVYDSWMFWKNKSDQLKIYTNFAELDEESPQGEAIESLPEHKEAPSSSTLETRDVALVLDVSGSMSGDPIGQMKEAAQGFLDTAVGGGAQVGLVSYSGEAQVLERLDSSATALSVAVGDLSSGGNTNIEDGLVKGEQVLSAGNADRRIIVLMSDGAPNEGKTGDGLIAYADELKGRGYKIYTVGFNEGPEGYSLLSQIASEGCHYEVQNAGDLEGFFTDIADEISGARFVYARVACPVDVEVSYGGETLSSNPGSQNLRTSFGTIALEDEVDSEGNIVEEDGIKVLRLREGPAYDLDITGVGTGEMDCSLGFADAKGDYTDFRSFENIAITPSTRVYTTTEETDRSRLTVDADGDGVIDYAYEASSNGRAQLVDNHLAIYLTFAGCAVVTAALGVAVRELRGWGRLRAA